jgi:hypothetical protein
MIAASDWRPLERNTLRGFVTLTLDPIGIVIRECTLHRVADGREWIGLPARRQTNKDGSPRIDPNTNKPAWTPLVEIPNKEARARFQKAALAAVHALVDEARAL